MKDDRGVYYHPFPQNKKVRMYVREENGEIFFRMWNSDDETLWVDHKWVPWGAIRQAAAMYDPKKGGFDPQAAYDVTIARQLIKDGK